MVNVLPSKSRCNALNPSTHSHRAWRRPCAAPRCTWRPRSSSRTSMMPRRISGLWGRSCTSWSQVRGGSRGGLWGPTPFLYVWKRGLPWSCVLYTYILYCLAYLSLEACMFCVFPSGRPPFNGANHIQLLQNIERQESRIHDSLPTHLSSPCRHLISALLKRLPEQRIGFDEFFNHPFFQGSVNPQASHTSLLAIVSLKWSCLVGCGSHSWESRDCVSVTRYPAHDCASISRLIDSYKSIGCCDLMNESHELMRCQHE